MKTDTPTLVLTHNAVLNAARGLRTLAELEKKNADGKPTVVFPFRVQYRLGRLAEKLNRAERIIEKEKNRLAIEIAAEFDANDPEASFRRALRTESVIMEYLEEVNAITELEGDKWVRPILLSELGVPMEKLTQGSSWVRDLGELFIFDEDEEE